MASRVVVNVTVRDLTRTDLRRIRGSFSRLGQDLDRAIGNRTRTNFARLSTSVNTTRRQLDALRGSIPDDEFFRMDDAIRRAQRTMQRGFGRVGARAFARVSTQIRAVVDDFDRLNRAGNIRIRVDDSALRRADARLATGLRSRVVRLRTVVDPPNPHRTHNFLLRALSRPFRSAGGFLGGLMSDGIGQGILGGVKAAGPVLGTAIALVLATALVAAMSLIGAAIAGALVLAIGGAFVVLGGIIASQAPVIQRNWKTAIENVKKDWSNVGDALVEPMHRLIHTGEQLSKTFSKHVREAMTAAAPHVETFVNRVIEGFKKLGGTAAADLEEAFNVFLDAMGPEFEDMLAGLGDSLAALARTVRDHSTEIASALGMVLSLITTAIDIVNFFANAWVDLSRMQSQAVGRMIMAMATIVDLTLAGIQRILEGFAKIPFVGKTFEPAVAAVKRMRDSMVADMRTVGQGFLDAGGKLDKLNKERKIKVNIDSLTAKLKVARADLQKTNDKKVQAKVRANIAQLESELRKARGALAALDGQRAIVEIITYSKTYKSVHDIVGKATGGVVGQAASGGVRSNMTLVGEQGPEMVSLPPGSHVRSNPDSRRLGRGMGGGGGQPMIVQLVLDGKVLAEQLVDPQRRVVKRLGGVQATFGTL